MAINTSNNKVRIISTTVSGLATNSKFSDITSPALVVNTSEGGVFYTSGNSSTLTQLAALPNHSHSNYSTTDHTHANYLSVPAYNYTNGCLVRTNIPTSSNTMATFRIEGNSYGSGSTIFTTGHFYNYTVDNNILSCQATHFGFNFGNINVFCYDGYVHLWFEQTSSYQSFIVYVYSTNNGADCVNRVSYITNGAMPSSGVTRLVEITPRKGLDNYNYSSYCASVGHTHNYLSKSGGEIVGLLQITRNPAVIKFDNASNTTLGYLGFYADDDPVIYKADGTTMRHIIHSGNISSQSVASATTATNADMLDNVHIKDIPYARFSSAGLGTSEESGNADTLPRTMFFRDNSANAIGYNVYHSQANTYGMQLVTGYADSDYRIRTKVNGEWKKWRKLATTEDTVAAALKSDSLYITGVGYSTSWNWEGKTGTPDWVWGGTDGTNMYVYKPANFSVNYATSAGSVVWSNVTGKPEIYTKSSVGTLDWTSSKGKLINVDAVAHWNGAYQNTSSNLAYCNRGAFGTIVTKNTDDYATANHTHPGYISHAVYNTRDSHDGSGYYLITINSTAAWMLAFHVRTYKSYTYQDIRFSGYNYGNSYWYTPTAEICSGDADSSVYFGYTSAYNLWVAIPSGNYTGIEISECLNGYTQTNLTNKDLFTITYVTSLPGTVQKEVKIKCPTNKYAAATHTHNYFPLSGGSLSGYLSSSDYLLGTGLIRVNAAGSTTNFGYIKAETYNTNRSVVHIGSNYGGSASISNSVSYDAIGIYRTCVGIGGTFTGATLSSNYDAGIKLDINGSARGTNFITTSDERLKDFIDDISIDFDKLKTIPKKTYYWKDKEKYSSDLQIGTSAQALQKVYPECVNYDEANDVYSVDYQKLSIVALAAIDILNERISKLEEIILNSSK